MQSSLGDLVESNIQGGTQKQINRPSDNPASAALILNTRNEISNTTQYERNVDTARGWLSMADDTYQQLSTAIISIKELALQASTGHLTEENREEISYQLDQLFGQVLNLSNVEYEGNSIFGGHNYTESAFDQVLGVSTKDENIDTSLMRVSGASDESLAVRFLNNKGDVGTPPNAATATIGNNYIPDSNNLGALMLADIEYEWSNDGGATWNTGVLAGDETSISVGGVTLDLQPGTEITFPGDGKHPMTYESPAATPIDDVNLDVYGNVEKDVAIQIVGNPDLSAANVPVEYQISVDGGVTWSATQSVTTPDPATGSIALPFSDGMNDASVIIDVNHASATTLPAGMRIDISAHAASEDEDVLPTYQGPANMGLHGVEFGAYRGVEKDMAIRIVNADADLNVADTTVRYQVSSDGGKTWPDVDEYEEVVVPDPPTNSISLPFHDGGTVGSVTIDLSHAEAYGDHDNDPLTDPEFHPITSLLVDTEIYLPAQTQNRNSEDGTLLYIHPTAQYNGDANDASAYPSASYPAGTSREQVGMTVHGSVDSNVIVEITQGENLTAVNGGTMEYEVTSYDSMTNTWNTVTMTAEVPDPPTGKILLPLDPSNSEATIELDFTNAHIRNANGQTTPTGNVPTGMTIDIQPRRVDMAGAPADTLVNAQGLFEHNILVRLDNDVDLTAQNSEINYSYSDDGGRTWIAATAHVGADDTARLPLPTGYVDITAQVPGTLNKGTQFNIHPDRADLKYEIMEDTYVDVNQVGKDTFGGMYQGTSVDGPNLFETIGKLIAYTEYNDVDGISKMYAELTSVQEHVLTQATKVGGIENRLDLAEDVLSATKLDQQERLSYAEDIDLTTLMNNLAKQELTYTTVLQSTSQILQLNLMQYL